MKTTKCPSCGEADMVLEVIPRHETRLGGIPLVVPDASIARCPTCGETLVSATEMERWRDVQRQQLQEAGQVPSSGEVARIRGAFGFSVSDFAVVTGVTRQTVHAWERARGAGMPFGPASLLVGLLGRELARRVTGVCSALVEAATDRGQEVKCAQQGLEEAVPRAAPTQKRSPPGPALRARAPGAPSFCVITGNAA